MFCDVTLKTREGFFSVSSRFEASAEFNSLTLELAAHRSSFMSSDHRLAHPDEPVA
jgi:hypothetical protein